MRIQQHATFLLDMVRQVRAGQLAPAAFQRPYVWSRDDVLALCTSILEGYPIGGFLSWMPYQHANIAQLARKRLGPIQLKNGSPAVSLLLDGQNRLASLAWMLRDTLEPLPDDLSEVERATWGAGEELAIDMAARELRFVPHASAAAGFTLPMASLFDSTIATRLMLQRWEQEWSIVSEDERNAGLRWHETCANAFRNARIVETVLENASPAQARKAFLHICRVGVPMSQEDFDAAIGWND